MSNEFYDSLRSAEAGREPNLMCTSAKLAESANASWFAEGEWIYNTYSVGVYGSDGNA